MKMMSVNTDVQRIIGVRKPDEAVRWREMKKI